LIVDQEISIIDSIKKTEGYEVFLATNIDDAYVLLRSYYYDIIFLDIMMHRLVEREDFLGVLKNMRNETQVVFTGVPQVGFPIRMLKEKIYNTIRRPVIMQNFTNKISKILFLQTLLNFQSHFIRYHKKLISTSDDPIKLGELAFNLALFEGHDSYSANHQRRVGNLTADIAALLGFNPLKVNLMRFAGYIHDIGKLNIPKYYLNKRGTLSALERQVINTHSRKGYEMVEDCNLSLRVAEIVLQHHERIDGSGYPQGLLQKDIHDESLVIMVADVADAMISNRPYRIPFRVRDMMVELKKNAGTLYDSEVVDACCFLFKDEDYILYNLYI
jgi:putative nucleotidyltransferase with HDIG domain